MIRNPTLPSDENAKANDMVLAFTRQVKTIYLKRFDLSEAHVEATMNDEAGKDGTVFDAETAVKVRIIPGDNILPPPN